MTTTMVTGAAGFVGANVVRALASHCVDVVAVARRAPKADLHSFLSDFAARITWVEGDVRDERQLVAIARDHRIDAVVHAAAITPSPAVERSHGVKVVGTNILGTANALEALLAVGGTRFVLVSSTGVYGAPVRPIQPVAEDLPLLASNLYTICKVSAEALCRRYAALHGFSSISARLGTVYGPMERVTDSRANMSFIYQIATRALAGDRLSVWGGSRLRDFCYVEDVAGAIAALTLAQQLRWDTYNVAADVPLAVRDALDVFLGVCPGFAWQEAKYVDEADLVIRPEQERAPADLSRLRADLDYQPRHDLAGGIAAYATWLRSSSAAGNAAGKRRAGSGSEARNRDARTQGR